MAIDVAHLIGDLLYQHDSVVIPGLGGIMAGYQSASIDHVQGIIHPPSKKLSFNENLILNDGVLLDCLREKHQLTLEEAEKVLSDFVDRTQQALLNREIVLFPNVGRLYQNYENSLQFLQDTSVNFSTSVYGLPALQYYPILRPKENHFKRAEELATQPSHQQSKRLQPMLLKALPLLIGLVIIAAALGVYRTQKDNLIANNDAAIKMPVAVENRINQKPTQENNFSFGKGLFDTPATEKMVEPAAPTEKLRDTESPTMAPELKECVIIVGAFSKKAGVQRRVDEIIELGYSVYQDKKGRLTRVGIQFAYQESDEIREKMNVLRDRFDNRAWILKE